MLYLYPSIFNLSSLLIILYMHKRYLLIFFFELSCSIFNPSYLFHYVHNIQCIYFRISIFMCVILFFSYKTIQTYFNLLPYRLLLGTMFKRFLIKPSTYFIMPLMRIRDESIIVIENFTCKNLVKKQLG